MSDIPQDRVEEELDLTEIGDDPEPEPDEPEPEEGEDEPPEGEDEPAPVAAETRQQRRKGEAQRYRERLERTERELAELKARAQQPAAPAFDPAAQARAEQEFLASLDMMSPAEAIRAIDQRRTAQFQQAIVAQQNVITDRIDKQAYDAEARTSPIHQRYRERVETALRAEHAVGNFRATRADVLAYLVGQDAIQRAGRAAPAQQRRAAARVNGQRVRPVNGRSDGGAEPRNRVDDDERLLRGIRVEDF